MTTVYTGNSELVIYTTEDGLAKVDVRFDNDTVWLSQDQMALLFEKAKSTINEHIKNIYSEGELIQETTMRKFGNSEFSAKPTNYYNLDVVISVGYRVKSRRGIQFRMWAADIIKEYLRKGFVLDDERMKQLGGGTYWKELLDRIRDIRSSEKVLYRQVLDLYATSIDYNPKSDETVRFFKIVQNKLHYAAHGHTAAEVIYERADASKPFMGLMAFKGEMPVLSDIGTAKNYLTEDELKILNNIVSGYFDFAELQAIRHKPMRMADYVEHLDRILESNGENLLDGTGKVSHEQAMKKAAEEYRKYQAETVSSVEKEYMSALKSAAKNAKENSVRQASTKKFNI